MTLKRLILLILGLYFIFSEILYLQCESNSAPICYDLGALEALVYLLALSMADFIPSTIIVSGVSALLIYLERRNIYICSDIHKIIYSYLLLVICTCFLRMQFGIPIYMVDLVQVLGIPIIFALIGFNLVKRFYPKDN